MLREVHVSKMAAPGAARSDDGGGDAARVNLGKEGVASEDEGRLLLLRRRLMRQFSGFRKR